MKIPIKEIHTKHADTKTYSEEQVHIVYRLKESVLNFVTASRAFPCIIFFSSPTYSLSPFSDLSPSDKIKYTTEIINTNFNILDTKRIMTIILIARIIIVK